jgi:hypothetical protein
MRERVLGASDLEVEGFTKHVVALVVLPGVAA